MEVLRNSNLGYILDIFNESILYFESSQNTDGGFPYNDIGSPSGAWNTSSILWALANLYNYEELPFLNKAVKYLYSVQNNNGWIPFTYKGDKACIDATAHYILALGIIYRRKNNNIVLNHLKKAALWLCSISKNGSFGTVVDTESVISSTSNALIALKSVEDIINSIEVERTILAGVNWLLNNRNTDFGWGIYPNTETKSGSTAFALSAIIDCLPSSQHKDMQNDFKKGIEIILSGQLENGNWLDIIERRAGLTLIRISCPYCLVSLLKLGVTIYNTNVQKGYLYLIRSFKNGKVTYQDSDIVTWSTRDALIALSELQKNITNKEMLSIFDENIKMKNENETLKQEFEHFKINSESIILKEKESLSIKYKSKFQKFRTDFEFYRNITSFLTLAIFALVFILIQKILSFSNDKLFFTGGILMALWGGLNMFIKSRKIDDE